MSVLVYIETQESEIKKSSLEVASYGRAIADAKGSSLIAVCFGMQDTSLLSQYGVDKVFTTSTANDIHFNVERYSNTLAQIATKEAAKDSYGNFHDFEKRLPDYLHYHLAKFNDTNIAMAGMFQSKQWPSKFVRVLDRCYYFKIARSSTLSFLNEKDFKATASTYFLPLHIK